MTMFLLGMLVMYLISGIIILICNTLNVNSDNIDMIFGFWLIPIIYLINEKILKKSWQNRIEVVL